MKKHLYFIGIFILSLSLVGCGYEEILIIKDKNIILNTNQPLPLKLEYYLETKQIANCVLRKVEVDDSKVTYKEGSLIPKVGTHSLQLKYLDETIIISIQVVKKH